MLFGILIFLFVIICIVLCLLVLIQSDKGGGISGALGGGLGGASSLLGTQDTANILTRGTTIFATAFFLICIFISFLMGRSTVEVNKSLLQQRAEKQANFSPSSVLGNQSLPIQEGAEPAATNPAGVTPGKATEGTALPIVPPAEESKKGK
jgi:preprotein translocase subunit SecG